MEVLVNVKNNHQNVSVKECPKNICFFVVKFDCEGKTLTSLTFDRKKLLATIKSVRKLTFVPKMRRSSTLSTGSTRHGQVAA